MWTFFVTSLLCLALSAARPIPGPRVSGSLTVERDETLFLQSDFSQGHILFELPCAGCFNSDAEADESLVLHLQVDPTDDLFTSAVYLNGSLLNIHWKDSRSVSSQHLLLDTAPTGLEGIEVSWIGAVHSEFQEVEFSVSGLFGRSEFTAIMRPTSSPPMVGVTVDRNIGSLISSLPPPYQDSPTASLDGHQADDESDGSSDGGLDLSEDIEELLLLQDQAKQLDAQITMKQKAIAYKLKDQRDQLCLKHLIKECDGVVSTAKAIWQRVCDKVGIKTDPSFGISRLSQLRQQQSIAPIRLDDKSSQKYTNESKTHAEGITLPLMQSKGSDDQMQAFSGFDLTQMSNPLFKALSIIAAVLGIASLFAFLKRKCSSMRTRVERAADREERRNARAYRRAARRALMRKRWNSFINTFSCFKAEMEPRTSDYEEKRALILQDAFLEQELDQAEKGDIMEAEIRELRHAHEIVSSLVQVGEHRFEMVTPTYQPPPPLPAQISYTASDARSRANSTYTLPSYTSESLPDYTSRPGDQSSTASVVNGYTPSTSESQGRQSPVSPLSESSRHSRYTPTSSVLDMSPRPSAETLRTRPSGETAYR